MSEIRIPIPNAGYILESHLVERFVHSGGPGGQNVNKVSTGVQLRYNPRLANTLPERVIENAEKLAGQRLNAAGEIIIMATRFRSQEKNRTDARNRLVELLSEAAKPPPKKRRVTKPSLGSQRRRLDRKRKAGQTKKLRGRVNPD